MFKFLKEKLKSWKDKVKKEFSDEEEPSVKKEKTTSKKSEKKNTQKPSKDRNKTTKKGSIENKVEQKNSIIGKESHFKEEAIEIKQEEKKGFFDRFKKKFTEEKFDELFQELEIIMIQNNVAYGAVESIKEELKENIVGKNISEINLEEELKKSIEKILINPPNFIKEIKEKLKEKRPFVITFVGINGSGKTTTIAKIANLLKKEKLSVCLAAGDTFRSAAIEQLEIHANNLKIPIIKKDYNSDPASVGFEAISYAKKNNIDIVLMDTAGRMNTKESLMKEMEKIIRVCQPDLKIFLGESITGNDATEQAKSFNDHISIDGIILSKADIDEKGGTALSVSYITKKPIYFLGTGQNYDDLEIFSKENIIKNLGL